MSHEAFRALLAPEDRARLAERSDAAGLRHLALHWGLIGAFGTLIALRVPGWPLLMVPQGLLLAFLFTLQHECTHATPFASGRLSTWVGRIAGLPILQPFEWFRLFHLAHHRHTNDPARDPELAGGKPRTWAHYALHVSGWTFWAGHVRTLAASALARVGAPYIPERAHPRLVREARVMLAVYAGAALCTLLVSPVLLRVWLIPVLIAMPALRLYVLAEHGRCPHVADLFENTRTTLTSRAVRWLAWNMPYHAEHHAYPDVPFHRLPELHAMARPHLGVVGEGYGAVTADYARGLHRA